MDNGKKLIREYADTSDAQQVFVIVEHLKSTKAQLNAPKLLAYLTTVKLAACNRNGSYEFFTLQRYKEYKDSGSHLSSTVEWYVTEKAHQEPLSRRHREYKGSHWSFTDEWSENGEAVEDVITSNEHIQTTVIVMFSSHAAPHDKHLGKFKCMYVCPAKLKTRLSTFAWKNQEQIIDACSTLRCSKDLVHGETVMSGDNEFVSNSSMPSTESMQEHCGMGRLGQFSCRSYSSDVGYYRLLIWHRSSYRFGTKGSDKINTRFPGRDSYPPMSGNRLHSQIRRHSHSRTLRHLPIVRLRTNSLCSLKFVSSYLPNIDVERESEHRPRHWESDPYVDRTSPQAAHGRAPYYVHWRRVVEKRAYPHFPRLTHGIPILILTMATTTHLLQHQHETHSSVSRLTSAK
jgi:hypothetical protein